MAYLNVMPVHEVVQQLDGQMNRTGRQFQLLSNLCGAVNQLTPVYMIYQRGRGHWMIYSSPKINTQECFSHSLAKICLWDFKLILIELYKPAVSFSFQSLI